MGVRGVFARKKCLFPFEGLHKSSSGYHGHPGHLLQWEVHGLLSAFQLVKAVHCGGGREDPP